MANEQNLIPNSERTPEELREITRKGGIASGEARRKKKTLKEIGDMIGSLDIKDEKVRALLAKAGIEEEDMVRDAGMMFTLAIKAGKGDTRSAELIAKIRGQLKEQQSIEVAEVKPLVDLTARKRNGEDNETN